MTSRILAILGTIALPDTAQAHPGHIVESGGHGHLLALAILGGLGIALSAWALTGLAGAAKRRRQS